MNIRNPDTLAQYVNLSWIAHRWGITLSSVTKGHCGVGKLTVRKHGRELLVHVDDLSRYEARLRRQLRERLVEQEQKINAFLGALDKPLMPVIGD